MKINCHGSKISNALAAVQSIAPSSPIMPILSNVLIKYKDNNLYFITTDLEIRIVYKLDVDVEAEENEDKEIIVPAKRFNDIMTELINDEIAIDINNNHLNIKSNNSKLKLLCSAATDFPKAMKLKDSQKITLSQEKLKNMLQSVIHCTQRDSSIYSGVLMDVKQDELRFVATEGSKLGIAYVKQNHEKESKIVIPPKIIFELIRNLTAGEVEIYFNSNKIQFKFNDIIISSVLMQNSFPGYENFTPKEIDNKLIINKEEFSIALKKVGLFTEKNSLSIKFEITKDKIKISKTTADLGSAIDEVNAVWDRNLTISFNYKFLLDALHAVKGKTLKLELIGTNKPMVLRENGFIFIMLPIQD